MHALEQGVLSMGRCILDAAPGRGDRLLALTRPSPHVQGIGSDHLIAVMIPAVDVEGAACDRGGQR